MFVSLAYSSRGSTRVNWSVISTTADAGAGFLTKSLFIIQRFPLSRNIREDSQQCSSQLTLRPQLIKFVDCLGANSYTRSRLYISYYLRRKGEIVLIILYSLLVTFTVYCTTNIWVQHVIREKIIGFEEEIHLFVVQLIIQINKVVLFVMSK